MDDAAGLQIFLTRYAPQSITFKFKERISEMSDKIELTKEDIERIEKRLAEEQASMADDEKQLLKALLQMAKNRPSLQAPQGLHPNLIWTYQHSTSSKRFKTEIKPMEKVSEAVLALKPVTFLYKADTTDTPQFGLIAEEVAAVNPDLVMRDENGDVYTVRYDAVNAMLLNEFLKEHQKMQQLTSRLAQQEKQIAALRSGLQKVSARLEESRPAAQVVKS
jgi:DNA repair exonuclease SbcCD ATPase subunit